MTRLRRSRLAGALVALGILFYPEILRGSSFSELFVLVLICPTSLADLVQPLPDQVGRSSRRLQAFAGRKSSQLTLNNKWFSVGGGLAAPRAIVKQ
jgi:hypothetical protein